LTVYCVDSHLLFTAGQLCIHDIAMSSPSVCLSESVRLSVRVANVWILTKRKQILATFYTIWKIDNPGFATQRMVGGEHSLLSEKILGKTAYFQFARSF